MSNLKLKDVDAERTVIASLIKDKARIDRVLLDFKKEYFTDALYKNFYFIITETYIKHGSLLTHEYVSNYLEAHGIQQEERISYLKEMDELCKLSVTDAEFSFGMDALRKAYVASCVSDILTRTSESLDKKGGYSAYKTLDKLLYDLKLNVADPNYLKIIDSREVTDILERYKDMRENPDKYKGMKVGWSQLDLYTGGFQPGEYVLIVAKSGGGKSMGLLNWADSFQTQGYNVVYVSLEMEHWEVRTRQLALNSGIPYINLKTQNLTVGDLQKMEDTLKNNIAKKPGAFHIIDTPKCTVGFIEAQIRQLQKNMKIDAIFVDYLGLIKPEVYLKGKQGWETLAGISNDLRELARTMKIMVCTAHQVTGDGMKKKADDDIELGDIALSKRVADPAHAVIGLLWDKTSPNDMKLCVPKCRGARVQSAKLWCDLNVCKISDLPEGSLISDNDLQVPDAKDIEI